VTRRLVILTEIISPYRIPLFNSLARDPDVNLHVIFLSETDPGLRQWQVYKSEIQFSYQILPAWRKRLGRYNVLLNSGLSSALKASSPDVILCGGYNYVASWQALFWARARNIPFVLWCESNVQDLRRGNALVEMLKDGFFKRSSGFVVPGKSAREYVRVHEIADDRIFTAPNAVDNELFATAAKAARQNATALRAQLGLPERYVLFVGRLVRGKGVFELLSAYAKLDERTREQVGLVYAGDGVARRQLEAQSASISPGMVRFAGFVQRDPLATYYALADMLVLPTYNDPWGLVVNEAMACGLPVIVSQVAGCAADLVKENWNGMLINPMDVSALAAAIDRIAENPELRAAMGTNSAELISSYSPAAWSLGISQAVAANGGACD
jgi:glycosyltransferase involved in cell wall biosynthesis